MWLFALWGVGVVFEASRGSWTVSWDDDRTQEFTLGASGGVWVFRTVCFERVVLSSPGCLWPGRMDDHEEVLEAHA